MKLIKYQGRIPVCIEDFPEDAQRCCEGALHLRPSQTHELSDDEFAYVKANRPDVKYVLLRDTPDKQQPEDLPEPQDQPDAP